MSLDAKDVIALIPSMFSGAKALAGLVSPNAFKAVGFAEEITQFIIDAEVRGLSQEALVEGVSDLSVQLIKKLKFGA
jgi:hypothetical protein